jgi:hypothetical protein
MQEYFEQITISPPKESHGRRSMITKPGRYDQQKPSAPVAYQEYSNVPIDYSKISAFNGSKPSVFEQLSPQSKAFKTALKMDYKNRYAERDFTFYDLNHLGKERRAISRLDQNSTPYQYNSMKLNV